MISEGQAKKYCYEDISLIENYEKAIADKTQVWHCHHRVETIMNCGAEELKAKGCYKNRPAHDLIFLPPGEHSRLHSAGIAHNGENNPMFGKHHSPETCARMRAAHIGKKPSAETRAKLSAARIGKKHSAETLVKMSVARIGKKHSAETLVKMSVARSAKNFGNHWWTNGTDNKFCKECPGEGWKRGRLIRAQ